MPNISNYCVNTTNLRNEQIVIVTVMFDYERGDSLSPLSIRENIEHGFIVAFM